MLLKYNVMENVNWLLDATFLIINASRQGDVFDPDKIQLIEQEETFSMSKEEINAEFKDVHSFLIKCIREAHPIVKKNSFWKSFAHMEKTGVFDSSYLLNLIAETNKECFSDITFDEFMKMNLGIFGTEFYRSGSLDEGFETVSDGYFRSSDWRGEKPKINIEDIYALVDLLNYSDSKKLAILRVYLDSKAVFEEFKEVYAKCEAILKKNIKMVDKRMLDTRNMLKTVEWQEKLESIFKLNSFVVNLDEKSIEKLRLDEGVRIYTGPMGFATAALRMTSNESVNLYHRVYVGVLLLTLNSLKIDMAKTKEKIIEQSKALGDNMRFQILTILNERSYFVKELAEKLEISSASLSHHLSILYEAGFIEPKTDERKTYYTLRKKTFEEFGNYFIGMFRGGEDGD